jgi:predicted transcriptional regulator
MDLLPFVHMLSRMSSIDRGRAKMVAGLANHRRIEIIRLLIRTPSLCVNEVATECRIDQSTAVEHVKRLHEAGLVKKKGPKLLSRPSMRSGKSRSDLVYLIDGLIAIHPYI